MWSDAESHEDYLNFSDVSALAVDVLTTPTMLPVSVGIFGNWGCGKSSLLNLIRKELQAHEMPFIVVDFDAWLFQGFDDARASLLEVIASRLSKEASLKQPLVPKALKLLKRVDKIRALAMAADVAATLNGIPTGGVLTRLATTAKALLAGASPGNSDDTDLGADIRKLGDQAKQLVTPAPSETPPEEICAFRAEYAELLEGLGRPLVVTIDNLDRCLPENAIQTLEAIRLLLFLPNTAFIVAADEEMVRLAVAKHFAGISPKHQIDYLDKLIQIPIRVPKSGVLEVRAYLFMLLAKREGFTDAQTERLRDALVVSLQDAWHGEPMSRDTAAGLLNPNADQRDRIESAFLMADRIAPILAKSPAIQGNPRIVKRLLNLAGMRRSVAQRRKMQLDEGVILKLAIFERCASADATAVLYRMIDAENGAPPLLGALETNDADALADLMPETWEGNESFQQFLKDWARLEPRLAGVDLKPLVYLSRETLPIGLAVSGVSLATRTAVSGLLKVKRLPSNTGEKLVASIASEDRGAAMEMMLDALRLVPSMTTRPDGFSGACLLARKSDDGAHRLIAFIQDLDRRPPWLQTLLDGEAWFKE